MERQVPGSRFVIAKRYLSEAIPRLPRPFGPRNDKRSKIFIATILRSVFCVLRSIIKTLDARR